MSIASLAVLIGILAAINEDVRNEVTRRLSSPEAMTQVASGTRKTATTFVRAAHYQTFGYASLVLFAGAAGALFFFMLRVDSHK